MFERELQGTLGKTLLPLPHCKTQAPSSWKTEVQKRRERIKEEFQDFDCTKID